MLIAHDANKMLTMC